MAAARSWWLAAALALLLPTVPARGDEATDLWRHAANLASEGLLDEAVAALPDTGALRREDARLAESAARSLLAERPAAAAHVLAAIVRLDPEAVRPRTALESIWEANPWLDGLYAADVTAFPVGVETATFGRLTVTTLSPKPFLRSAGAYPGYPTLVAAYVQVRDKLALRFTVHGAKGVDPAVARKVGRTLSALADLTDRLLAGAGRARYPVPVWLAAGGAAGARQGSGSILVGAADSRRTDLEWVRELAHEWGHACLPGIDGFTQPEAWANGDLGERLFLPMLREAGRLDAWARGIDITPYLSRYVNPPLESFRRTGPVASLIRDRTRAGYNHFLGACLYIREAYGARLLVEALDAASGGTSADFLRSVADTLRARGPQTISRAGPAGLRPICIPKTGRYSVDGLGVHSATRSLSGTVGFQAGWTLLKWDGVLSLRPAGTANRPAKNR